MARQGVKAPKTKVKGKGKSKASSSSASIPAIQSYEDTVRGGEVDEFMHNRDKISLEDDAFGGNHADTDSDDDVISHPGQRVFSLPEDDEDDGRPTRRRAQAYDDDEEEYDEEDDDDESNQLTAKERRKLAKAQKKEASKASLKTKGRFGKPDDADDGLSGSDVPSGEDEAEDGSDTDEEGGWGRAYYSRPSTRRARDDAGDFEDEERKEEERELEDQEAKRLQRKLRAAVGSRGQDWGLDDINFVEDSNLQDEENDFLSMASSSAKASKKSRRQRASIVEEAEPPSRREESTSSDPAAVIERMALREPVKLALAREFPLVVRKLEKTERGIRRMLGIEPNLDENGEPLALPGEEVLKMMGASSQSSELHHGLGWTHYHILLTYATTLAFYLHLAALPAERRPNLNKHPILTRLLQLKEGLQALEDLDFDAASVDEDDKLELYNPFDEAEDENEDADPAVAELAKAKREMVGRLLAGGQISMEDLITGEEDDSWQDEGLEDGELEGLQADAEEVEEDEDEDDDDQEDGSEDGTDEDLLDDLDSDEFGSEEEDEDDASDEAEDVPAPRKSSGLLEEPEFVPSTSTQRGKKSSMAVSSNSDLGDLDDDLGDPTFLHSADSADKTARKRSLRFHTSKIAATSARRAAARNARMGGDDDVPYKDRQAARDAALRRNGPEAVGADDLDVDVPAKEWTENDRKRVRDVDEDADGYYELVKRRRSEEKESKQAAYDQARADERAALMAEESANGPRSLTRAIEKNRGLTPRRAKSVRNPRVKKRERYEKAKQKVGSMRAVYKGGQSAQGGSYKGETSGISTASKSRRF